MMPTMRKRFVCLFLCEITNQKETMKATCSIIARKLLSPTPPWTYFDWLFTGLHWQALMQQLVIVVMVINWTSEI